MVVMDRDEYNTKAEELLYLQADFSVETNQNRGWDE